MPRPITAIVSRSTLRDVMNRLRVIRQKCDMDKDKEEGDQQGTGDPFQDKLKAFQKMAKDIGEMIRERNEDAQKGHLAPADIAQKSQDIRVEMRNLTQELNAIEALSEAAVRDLARTNKKIEKSGKQSPERQKKLDQRQRICNERAKAVQMCKEVLGGLKDLDEQRFMTAKEAKNSKEGGPGGAKKQPQLRQTLAQRLKQQQRMKERAANGGGGDDGGEEDGGAPNKRPEEDPETAQAYKELKEKEKLQDQALDRIGAAVGRITDIAVSIGQELDRQDELLQEAEDKADKATKDLKRVNRALTGFLKTQKPMNMIINVMCIFLVLGLAGFFLSEFGVL